MRYEIENAGRIIWQRNEIKVLIVEHHQRRQGYGSLLLKHAEQQISKEYDYCYLLAIPADGTISKEEVRNFYFKNGYSQLPWYQQLWYSTTPNLLIKHLK